MEELFIEEGRSIFTFRKGDIITKVKPREKKEIIYNENLGTTKEIVTGYDSSFRTDAFEFMGISNNVIYLKYLTGFVKGKISKALLEIDSEGWDIFKLPEGLKLEDL